MTLDDFVKSLNADQSAALLAFRQQINDLRDKTHQELVTAKADELAQLKADVAAAKQALTDAAAAAVKDKQAALYAKDAEIAKLRDDWNKADLACAQAIKDRDSTAATLDALRTGQAALAKAAAEAHASGDMTALAEIITEAGKDDRQRQIDAATAKAAEAQKAAEDAALALAALTGGA